MEGSEKGMTEETAKSRLEQNMKRASDKMKEAIDFVKRGCHGYITFHFKGGYIHYSEVHETKK